MSVEFFERINLGNPETIRFVIQTVNSFQESIPLPDLKKYCSENSIELVYSFDGIADLLDFIGWLVPEKDNKVTIANWISQTIEAGITDQDLCMKLIQDIFQNLHTGGHLRQFIDITSLDFDYYVFRIAVFNNSIPLNMSGLKNLMINLGFFVIDQTRPYILYIEDHYNDFFENEVLSWLKESFRSIDESGISYDEFLRIKELQNEAGHLAEKFVYEFERKRLEHHPQKDSIKIISRINVKAGFDIISFNSTESSEFDRFIEVKSYSGRMGFYLSKNQAQTAELRGDKYFIYLVDSNLSENDSSKLNIVKNPYVSILLNDNWVKDPQSWFVRPRSSPTIAD